jgi:uncharacterized Fe-S cluster-containing radical SAM superfamily protein
VSPSITDPLALAEEVGKVVRLGEKRKCYRFRPAPYEGGIATGDCVGCGLRCLFCGSWKMMTQPHRVGQFYAPEEIVRNLLSIARKKEFRHIRISGNEPTLHRSHLLKVLEQTQKISNSFWRPTESSSGMIHPMERIFPGFPIFM